MEAGGSGQDLGSRRVVLVAIAGDFGVAAAKFFAAALTGSSAMFAEGVHSLADMGNELLLLQGGRRGRRAVGEEHAFGYGKTTYVWSLLVALSVFSIGGGVSIYEGIVRLTTTPLLTDPTWNCVVLGAAAVAQSWSWWVSRQELQRHRRTGDGRWRALQRDMDVLGFTVPVINSAAVLGIVIAAVGVFLSHALKRPYLDPSASVLIGLVLMAPAALLARKSLSLLIGASLDGHQPAQLRKIIVADPAVESVGHLQTMRLGLGRVLLTAAVRFKRGLDLDQVEQGIERLERKIKMTHPAVHLCLESGAFKQVARRPSRSPAAARSAPAPAASASSRPAAAPRANSRAPDRGQFTGVLHLNLGGDNLQTRWESAASSPRGSAVCTTAHRRRGSWRIRCLGCAVLCSSRAQWHKKAA